MVGNDSGWIDVIQLWLRLNSVKEVVGNDLGWIDHILLELRSKCVKEVNLSPYFLDNFSSVNSVIFSFFGRCVWGKKRKR